MKRSLYIIYFIMLFYVVWLMPSESKNDVAINIVPGETIRLYITALIHGFAPLHIILGNLIGNILLTLPIGFLLFKSIRHLSRWVVLFFSIYIPCYIEVIQLLLHLGGYGTRSIDIDDVLLNTLGIWLGFISATIIKSYENNR